MNIFEFAKENEKNSENYYRELARSAQSTGLARICSMLADEETKHYQVIERMCENTDNVPITDVAVLKEAGEIFKSMKQSEDKQQFGDNELELYRHAAEIEQESERFYREKQKQSPLENEKKIFGRLADEEHKHFILVDNIAELLEKPETFLENAEMYRFDDYAGGVF